MIAFVTRPIPEAGMALLRQAGLEIRLRDAESPIPRSELLAGVAEADALLCMLTDKIDAEVLDAGRLRVVSNVAVGVDNIDLEAAHARGIPVTNTPGALTDATADMAMALLLAVARRVPEGDAMVRRGAFNGWGPMTMLGAELSGCKLGIVGPGRIGSAVARRAAAFGMEILIHGLEDHPEWGPSIPLDDLLAQADFVSLHCPLTPDTHHLLDAERLGRMKPGSYLINTARGPVVDEAALAEVLGSGHLAGAALDVFEREPIVHPGLMELRNVVLAPHAASATHRTRDAMARMAARDLVAVLEGREPSHRVA